MAGCSIRSLGDSRLIVSRIAYGIWLTPGYTDNPVATRCVAAALDAAPLQTRFRE
jgi:hypothetical protein